MGSGSTPKYGIEYPVADDPTNVPGDMQTAMDDIDNLLSPVLEGILSARPSPSATASPRFYLVTAADSVNYGLLFLDTGSAWLALGSVNSGENASVGGNTLLTPTIPGNVAEQGDSGYSADAAHQHPTPSWGSNADPQPIGPSAQAGSSGRFADAQHVHPGGQIGDVTWSLAPNPAQDQVAANGQALSYTTYPGLYALATSQGWPQNSPPAGTFNVIDLRGQSPIGAGGSYTLGQFYGAATATLSTGNLNKHDHAIVDTGHQHVTNAAAGAPPASYQAIYTDPALSQYQIPLAANAGGGALNVTFNPNNKTISATTGITTSTTGSNTSFSILQPVVAMNPYIRAL